MNVDFFSKFLNGKIILNKKFRRRLIVYPFFNSCRKRGNNLIGAFVDMIDVIECRSIYRIWWLGGSVKDQCKYFVQIYVIFNCQFNMKRRYLWNIDAVDFFLIALKGSWSCLSFFESLRILFRYASVWSFGVEFFRPFC